MKVKLLYKIFGAFLIVALLPILVASYLFSTPLEKFLHNHIQSEAKARLGRTTILITDVVRHIDNVLTKTAHRIQFTDADDEMLKWIYQSHPQLNELIAVNMDGIVQVAVARFSYIAKGKKFAGCTPAGFCKKNIHFSNWNNEPVISLHYPILSLSTGKQRGVLHAQLSIDSLFNTFSTDRDEHIQYIVNAYNGHIIFHPDFNLVLNDRDASPLYAVHQVLAGADFAYGEYENFNGDKVVGVARIIPDIPFILVEETLFDKAYFLLIKGEQLLKTIIWASIFFILIAAYLFSRSITRPVTRLLAVTNKIKGGDLDTTIARKKAWFPDEISIFSNDFQLMIEALKEDRKQRDKALQKEQAAEEKLRKAQKMEAIGLLAGGVAHDLNNILSGIVSYPELLLLQLPKESKLRQPLETIKQSGERASEVVADLLTVARGIAATRETHNLNTLINEYCFSPECVQFRSAYPGITCRHELEPDLLNISCSPVHVKKCLMNLVNNAIEAMGKEGEVFISTRNQYVDKKLVPHLDVEPGNYAVLHVEDTGGGISKQDQERIFEPFYSKKVMGRSGTGLGLTVVWNTMQDHDGGVTVASSSKGTIFELYFPVTAQKRQNSTKQEKALPRGHGENILVVDDVKEQRDIACRMLKQLGYTAYTVASGEEAVSWIERNSVDLLLLDMIMPGMSGRETYEAILHLHPGQKAIIASGFSESTDIKTTLNLGAGDFIKKPYSMGQLAQAVFQALNKP